MADESETPPSARGQMPRVRRRAPTIELKATEVAIEPPSPPPEQELEPTMPPPASEGVATPEYPTEPPAYDVGAAAPAEAATQAPQEEPPPRLPGQEPPVNGARRPPFLGEYGLEAGIVGAIAALLVFGVLWLSGMFSAPANIPDQRFAAMDARVRELANRPAQADTKAIDDLTARLARLENTARNAANAPAPNLNTAALEEQIKALQADIARRADENAAAIREARARADAATAAAENARGAADAARQAGERNNNVEAVTTRLAALERALQTLSDNVVKLSAASSDKPLRAAVAAQALRTAVERGEPFAAELDTAKAAASDPKVLAPLEPFASTGLPSPSMLARQLSSLAPAMLKAEPSPAPAGGFLDRLQANAEKLVRITPVGETARGDTGSLIARAQSKVARGDLPGALADLKSLPENLRAPAEEWIKKAEACNAALNATRRFAADALAALGKSP